MQIQNMGKRLNKRLIQKKWKNSYKKHKKYLEQNIVHLNLDVFEYCLQQDVSEYFQEVRKLYKEDLLE